MDVNIKQEITDSENNILPIIYDASVNEENYQNGTSGYQSLENEENNIQKSEFNDHKQIKQEVIDLKGIHLPTTYDLSFIKQENTKDAAGNTGSFYQSSEYKEKKTEVEESNINNHVKQEINDSKEICVPITFEQENLQKEERNETSSCQSNVYKENDINLEGFNVDKTLLNRHRAVTSKLVVEQIFRNTLRLKRPESSALMTDVKGPPGCSSASQIASNVNRQTLTSENVLSCNQLTVKSTNKIDAFRGKPIKDMPYICGQCSYISKNKRDLSRHKLTHTSERPFACDQCSYTCIQKYSLAIHRLAHTGEKLFSCDQCSYTCNLKAHLNSHKRKHSDEKPFTCDECDFRCRNKASLTRHRLIHTAKKLYGCEQCSFTCNQVSSLVMHKLIHTGEKPFACDQCLYRCRDKRGLYRHKLIHTADKPYECDQCSFKCNRKSSLDIHKLAHTKHSV